MQVESVTASGAEAPKRGNDLQQTRWDNLHGVWFARRDFLVRLYPRLKQAKEDLKSLRERIREKARVNARACGGGLSLHAGAAEQYTELKRELTASGLYLVDKLVPFLVKYLTWRSESALSHTATWRAEKARLSGCAAAKSVRKRTKNSNGKGVGRYLVQKMKRKNDKFEKFVERTGNVDQMGRPRSEKEWRRRIEILVRGERPHGWNLWRDHDRFVQLTKDCGDMKSETIRSWVEIAVRSPKKIQKTLRGDREAYVRDRDETEGFERVSQASVKRRSGARKLTWCLKTSLAG